MNFFNLFKKRSPGTGEGQLFKDGIKALSFEIYRGVSILCIAQVDNDNLLYKYLFYTSVAGDEGRRVDEFHSGVAGDLDEAKAKAYKHIDQLTN